jgi:hypothetical protein
MEYNDNMYMARYYLPMIYVDHMHIFPHELSGRPAAAAHDSPVTI